MFFSRLLTFFISLSLSMPLFSACVVLNSSNQVITPQHDILGQLFETTSDCPTDVLQFRQQLKQEGLTLITTMVANRGFHNPGEGSFSLFEMGYGSSFLSPNPVALGDMFFGHFTGIANTQFLTLDQNPETGSLMIEAFAWDEKKGFYNFYELRGNGKQGQWYYRGDSADILQDNIFLHRKPPVGQPKFGSRLRCSACHGAGGPIMKELYSPHNDWWVSSRHLDLGGHVPDEALQDVLRTLVSAEQLKKAVHLGLKKLNQSIEFKREQHRLSLQSLLRPLFCPVEINFKSDKVPFADNANSITIPVDFFIDSRLINKEEKDIVIQRSDYQAALSAAGSHFPETNLQDADHAWLTPVKAQSDQLAVEALINSGLIDQKWMTDVLSVDMTNPVTSMARCNLLQLVPETYTSDWKQRFIENLAHSKDYAAQELLRHFYDRNSNAVLERTRNYLNACRGKLQSSHHAEQLFYLLLQRQLEVKVSEISQNPLGQILEPGFRLIFPETEVGVVAGKWALTEACDIYVVPEFRTIYPGFHPG